eukprot:3602794-Pleurochrysis_carterae.AAC.1
MGNQTNDGDTHIRCSDQKALVGRQVVVSHEPGESRQQRRRAKVSPRLHHGQDQRELPHFVKDVRSLKGDA